MKNYLPWALATLFLHPVQTLAELAERLVGRTIRDPQEAALAVARVPEMPACHHPESPICMRCPDRRCHVCTRAGALLATIRRASPAA